MSKSVQNDHVIVIHKTCLLQARNVVRTAQLSERRFNSHLLHTSSHISVSLTYYVRTVKLSVEALRYKPEVRGFIPDGVTGIFH